MKDRDYPKHLEEPYLPVEVSQVEMAFPASVRHLMPDPEAIDEEQLSWGRDFQSEWFFGGIENLNIEWAEGIDGKVAMRHLATIQGSFEPKHEHKEAAVAFLIERWTASEPSWTRKRRH